MRFSSDSAATGDKNKKATNTKVCVCAAGASVIASGQLVASPGSKQAVEIKADKLTLVGACDAETYPLQKVRSEGHPMLCSKGEGFCCNTALVGPK